MIQTQRSRQRRDSEEATETTEVETTDTTTNEVSEEAACCLVEIDKALAEVEERELTDEEIVAKGLPEWNREWNDLQEGDWEKAYTDWNAARVEFQEAYERVTGMRHESCTC